MKKIATVIGARPQFIKAAVVSRLLDQDKELEELIIHTGQHYDVNMSSIFFNELGIKKPQYNLGIGSGTHGKQTGEMITAIEQVLFKEKPDWLLIYGDTNSTLAGAIAAAKLHIPIAHVEAGLRSFNRCMPEEINRLVADQLADLLFTPSQQAIKNLMHEGFAEQKIAAVGDVMYDASLYFGNQAENKSIILKKLHLLNKPYLLATIHRAENTDNTERLNIIFSALEQLSTEIDIVIPLHPRTKNILQKQMPEIFTTSLTFIEPVGFLDMIMLEKHAKLIVTDSGGIQKEAFFYQIPCVTLRSETEWMETIELGWNKLITPNDSNAIVTSVQNMMTQKGLLGAFPYGKGNAAESIIPFLKQ